MHRRGARCAWVRRDGAQIEFSRGACRRHLDHPGCAAYKHALGARSSVVEHLTFNQGVDGSIPSGLTNYFNELIIILGGLKLQEHVASAPPPFLVPGCQECRQAILVP